MNFQNGWCQALNVYDCGVRSAELVSSRIIHRRGRGERGEINATGFLLPQSLPLRKQGNDICIYLCSSVVPKVFDFFNSMLSPKIQSLKSKAS